MEALKQLGFSKEEQSNGDKYTVKYQGCLVEFKNGVMKVSKGERVLEQTGISELTRFYIDRAVNAINE